MTTITIDRDTVEEWLEGFVNCDTGKDFVGYAIKAATMLRAALAAPATAPKSKPSIISAGAWPFGDGKKGRCSHCQRLVDVLAAPATAPEPAWHDAPTEPGFWVRSGDGCVGVYSIREEAIKILKGSAARWYGPIPQDAKAEGGAA